MSTSTDDVTPAQARSEEAAVLVDIRVAEDQIARGEGVEHDKAGAQVLARLHMSGR